MSANFEVMMAIRYLRSKNAGFFSIITLFSMLGIALGVATLIVVMSVMNGFRAKLFDSIISINGHINVSFDININSDYLKISELIKKIPGVSKAIPVTNNQAVIEFDGNIASVIVRGIALEDLSNIANNLVIENTDEKDGIIIGTRLAEVFNTTDEINLISPKGFPIDMKKYKVIGTFDSGIYEYDTSLVYMQLKSAQKFFHYGNSVESIEVFVDDITKSEKLANTIENDIGMISESWQKQQVHYFNALKTERSVMFLILALIILVASFNIISNLMIIVQEKKSNIAIMRTFGATSWSIMRIFCICGLLIGIVGTSLGCIIGIAFSLNIENIRLFLENIVNIQLFDPMVYFFSSLPVILLPQDVISTSCLALFSSFLATIPPSLRAASQDPAEILRYE
ncbi:MAG: lipoprotein-releasing ABC transporter permease subunit [Wolbachia endosymbiont of Fragariocoptes setiger]|nr:lipoprotein-releasing ABC transporter permease subunit [Wolbachia endosymbiont of Fragariocoptes setiger]